jgi:threonine-phosphate decarboxylase
MRRIPPPYTDPTPLFRHGGAPRGGGTPLLDFSASVNPLGPPESVLRVLRDSLPGIAHYPDPDCRELTHKLAALHGVDPDCIVVGNGSNELIYAVARALWPAHVAIAEPTYTEYLRASLLVGAHVDHWLAEGDDFKFEPFDPDGAEVVWLCDPNSPTGTAWPSYPTLEWVTATRAIFVVDEAFWPLIGLGMNEARLFDHSRWIRRLRERSLSNLIVLRSFTKFFGFPGLRLGYLATHADLARRIRAELAPWSVSQLAMLAGLAALDDESFQRRTAEWKRELHYDAYMGPLLAAAPWVQSVLGDTNFELWRLRGLSAARLCTELVEHGIIIRDASNFVGLDERYVRVAKGTPQQNERLFAALREIVV